MTQGDPFLDKEALIMKKYLVGSLVLLVALTTGCGDDETTPLTPGDPADADFQMFAQQFEGIDEGTGMMVEMTFALIDGVVGQAKGVAPVTSDFGLALVWDEQSDSWIGTFEFTAEDGTVISAEDVVQFFHGSTPVQYPVDSLLTEVRSALALDAVGPQIELYATQNLVIIPPVDDVVTVSGSGSFSAVITAEEEGDGGTTTCTFEADLTSTIASVMILDSETVEDECPVGGRVSFSGNFAASCTGAQTVEGSRSWSVSRTWDETGTSTTEYVSGGNIWTVVEPCL
jgi:hypothetical protein